MFLFLLQGIRGAWNQNPQPERRPRSQQSPVSLSREDGVPAPCTPGLGRHLVAVWKKGEHNIGIFVSVTTWLSPSVM